MFTGLLCYAYDMYDGMHKVRTLVFDNKPNVYSAFKYILHYGCAGRVVTKNSFHALDVTLPSAVKSAEFKLCRFWPAECGFDPKSWRLFP